MKQFIKNKANPVFGGPRLGTMFDVLIQPYSGEPAPIANPKFRMDVSWRPQKSLAVSFSQDGIRWTEPQISLSNNTESGWEDIINRNCVLKVGDVYRMWYTGQYLRNSYSAIGVAESKDGIHFTRVPHQFSEDDEPNCNPVLMPERNWEGASVMNPCVLLVNGTYRMYYAAGETVEPNVLAIAESKDGFSWKRHPVNPMYACNPEKAYERDRVGGCQVVYVPELGYLMFYIGYKDIDTACICCALSKDGRTNWRRCKGNPLVTPTEGEWDANACYKPSVFYDEVENRWHLWYNGRKDCDEYIGEASMEGTFTEADFE